MIKPIKEINNEKDKILELCYHNCIPNNYSNVLKTKHNLCINSCIRKVVSGIDFIKRLDNYKA